jgi:DNA-binding MurR/RpiR family transcriptional regulator
VKGEVTSIHNDVMEINVSDTSKIQDDDNVIVISPRGRSHQPVAAWLLFLQEQIKNIIILFRSWQVMPMGR